MMQSYETYCWTRCPRKLLTRYWYISRVLSFLPKLLSLHNSKTTRDVTYLMCVPSLLPDCLICLPEYGQRT